MTYEELVSYVSVSRETYERLKIYVETLSQWNQKINLVSPDTIPNIWKRHVIDSLQLLPYLGRKSLADLGTGAGIPGLILAISGIENITLVEADQKKVAFLKHISGLLGLRINILSERIERLGHQKFQIIMARALASINLLLSYSQPLLEEGGYCLFLKGKDVEKEVAEAQKKWQFKSEVYPSLTDPFGKIIKLSEVKLHGEDKSHCDI